MPLSVPTRPAVRRLALVAALAGFAALPAGARAQDPPKPAPLPWMAAYDAAKDQPVGMDEAELRAYLDKQLKSEWKKSLEKQNGWKKIWEEVLLLMTPAWKTGVPAFHLSKYEVTNAQWAKFLEFRRAVVESAKDDTLQSLTCRIWGLDADSQGPDVKRGWETLLRDNAGDLEPVLNPSKDPKWDPLLARAADAKLPAGLKLSYPTYLPPPHWAGGKVPEHERKKPMRYLSWEQAVDFCQWAGFHLPTEFEWERAARGPEGRWFPWGNTFEPLRAVWEGYNAAAIAAAKPECPPISLPGREPEKETPFPTDVDQLAAGATPEGVLHMCGNVSELTMSRSYSYPNSKTGFKYAHFAVIARGGMYKDKAEFLLAADRNAESHRGALHPTHVIDGYGFRLASYPVAGADLTALLAQRYNDAATTDGPFLWLPAAAGFEARSSASDVYLGFEAQRTAGILERQLANDAADHVFVTGPASGIAFLPVRGFPAETVKSASDLQRVATNPDRPVVLGVLTGTDNCSFALLDENKEKVQVSFADKRFHYATDERLQTAETVGAILVYEAPRILVYAPNSTLKSAARHRMGLLGEIEIQPEIVNGKGVPAPSGAVQGDLAVLETAIPLLDRKGNAMVSDSAASIRVTLRIPFVRNGGK